jgi:hypothetical protein
MNRVLAFYTIVILNTSLISGIGSMIIKDLLLYFQSGNSIRLKSELLDFIVTDALSISFKIWNGSLLFGTRSPAPNKYLISNLQTMSKAQNYTAFLHSSALEYHHTTQGTCIQLP